MLEPLLEHYNYAIPTTDILVRADSGFSTPKIYELCETYDSDDMIHLKSNQNLTRLAEELVYYDDNHLSVSDFELSLVEYVFVQLEKLGNYYLLILYYYKFFRKHRTEKSF